MIILRPTPLPGVYTSLRGESVYVTQWVPLKMERELAIPDPSLKDRLKVLRSYLSVLEDTRNASRIYKNFMVAKWLLNSYRFGWV